MSGPEDGPEDRHAWGQRTGMSVFRDSVALAALAKGQAFLSFPIQ